jgi:kynurenine formamidase
MGARICFGRANRLSSRMKTLAGTGTVLVVAFCGLRSLAAAGVPFAGGRWIDLTHDFSSETLYWPTAERLRLETEFHGQTPKGYFYAANRYAASEHGGTHIAAPIHDYAQSTLFESHRILFEKDVPAFENVAALDRLPATGAYVIVLPMKTKGGSGSPLRIVAWTAQPQ